LFRQVPEILSLFDYLELKNDFLIPCHFSIREHPNGKLDQLIVVAKKLELEKLEEKFPELKEYEVKRDSDDIMLTRESKDELVLPARMVQEESGELFLLNAPNVNSAITDLNLHFLLMFLLGHVARYKAPLLEEILEGNKKSENAALIEKFIETSEKKFPKLILDEISGKYFIFD
jgi:hypothetical protein